MNRSYWMDRLARIARLASDTDRDGRVVSAAIDREVECRASGTALSRRVMLAGSVSALAAGVLASQGCAPDDDLGTSRSAVRALGDVAIVGAGIAGLMCARDLERAGVTQTLYEASDRVGGRIWSLAGKFPGQVVERGGELIDTSHQTMRGLVREFGLGMEDLAHTPGEVAYYANGSPRTEAAVVEEYREFVERTRVDLRALGEPTADSFTPSDRAFDLMSLREYLVSRSAGPTLRKVIEAAYIGEYGLEPERQSCVAFLLFIRANRRSRFEPFGSSNERYHVVGGNEGIVQGIHAQLSRRAQLGLRLVRVARGSDGRIELTFQRGRTSVVKKHDAAVITVPFSVLRGVQLHSSLGLPTWKTRAIQEVQYGTNSKLMVGFTARPWLAQGSNGSAYADLANLQVAWETNPSRASASASVLTDYTGGELGARMSANNTQSESALFLDDLDRVFPGSRAAVRRDGRGEIVAHLEAWPRNPNALGSYSANHPGYFTTIADNEAKPVGNLFFAGEHTSSFYEYQGFMEGAALSGLRASREVADMLRGRWL